MDLFSLESLQLIDLSQSVETSMPGEISHDADFASHFALETLAFATPSFSEPMDDRFEMETPRY